MGELDAHRLMRALSTLAISILIGCAGPTRAGWSEPVSAPVAEAAQDECRRFHGPYHCSGAIAARPELIALLAGRPGGRLYSAAELLGRLDAREAIGPLRELLSSHGDERVRVHAALALVELRDAGSADLMVAFLHELEDPSFAASWPDVLEGLGELHGAAAYDYALDWMTRHPNVAGTRQLQWARRAAEIARAHGDERALPVLAGWHEAHAASTAPDDYLLVATSLGARVALGEEPLRTRMAAALGTSNAVVPVRPDLVVAGLGHRADEAPALARFASSTEPEASIAYDGIDRLAPELGEGRRRALIERMERFTPVREDREHPNFEERTLARHHASLARLGHGASATRLMELASLGDGSNASVVAATHALELGLPGADDAAASALAVVRSERRRDREDRVELLDTAARVMGAGDPRWAVALLDPPSVVQERALHHLARAQPGAGACAVVTQHVGSARERDARPALLALTVLGGTCREHIAHLSETAALPEAIRRPASEVLAMLP